MKDTDLLFRSASGFNWNVIRFFYLPLLVVAGTIAIVYHSIVGIVASVLFLIYVILLIPKKIEIHKTGMLIHYIARTYFVENEKITKIFASKCKEGEPIFTILNQRKRAVKSMPFKPIPEEAESVLKHFTDLQIEIQHD